MSQAMRRSQRMLRTGERMGQETVDWMCERRVGDLHMMLPACASRMQLSNGGRKYSTSSFWLTLALKA